MKPEGASAYADRLCRAAHAGNFDRPLAELAAAEWEHLTENPLLVAVRDAVARELTYIAAERFDGLLARSLHALAITPLTARTMTLDTDKVIHLVHTSTVDDVAMGVHLDTACGRHLWSDIVAPLGAALRGGWQEPEPGTTRCAECAPHTGDFPEAAERSSDSQMPIAQTSSLAEAVDHNTREHAAIQLEHLRFLQAHAVRQAVGESYREWLLETLAARARSGGDELLRDVLALYYNEAQQDLRAVGAHDAARDIAGLVTLDDWRAVVDNVLDDLECAADGALARTYLYAELRAIVAEKVRRTTAPLTMRRYAALGRVVLP